MYVCTYPRIRGVAKIKGTQYKPQMDHDIIVELHDRLKVYSVPPLIQLGMNPQMYLQTTSYLLKQSSTLFKRRQQNLDTQQGTHNG